MPSESLKEALSKVFSDSDTVICYRQGFDALHATPFFLTTPEQIDQAIWNPVCVHNLAGFLPSLKKTKKKVGIVVKGCDSRTIVQYMEEKLIDRDSVVVIGLPCTGVVSVSKVLEAIGHTPVESIDFDGDRVVVHTKDGEKTLSLKEVCPDKCTTCRYPTPLVYDHLIGDPITSDVPPEKVYEDVEKIELLPLEERLAYWKKELDRCIRCYACRNACPMCVCRESCVVESRNPHWMSQKTTLDEKFMFHMIHAIHLAGRCVECGECERACPMDIPVAKLKKKINKEMKQLFNYEPGVNPAEKPPMYTFQVDEATIKERKIS
jgi:formate dehydrogenase (coenzyme F420) beta subunit